MTATWIDWLAWPRSVTGEVIGVSWRAYPVFGLPLSLLALAVLVALVVRGYRSCGVELAPARRGLLVGLRIAALCCLLPALFDLALRLDLRHEAKPELAVAIDASASMALADCMIQTDAGGANAPAPLSRAAYFRRLVLGEAAPALEALEQAAAVRWFAFGAEARPLEAASAREAVVGATPAAAYTSLSLAVDDLVERLRGRPTAGVLLVTDGAHNMGPAPVSRCDRWREAGVPVHTLAIGDPNPKDLEVQQVLANPLLFRGDPATVVVRLRKRGYARPRVPVVLRQGTDVVASADAAFPEDSDEVNVSLTFAPREAGDFTFRAECRPLPDEITQENNHKSFVARVSAERIRVLYLENRPRWQFRFLRDAMVRDQRLRLAVLLTGGEPMAQPPPPFINSLPPDREGFATYDLIILGDVDPAVLTETQMEAIREVVREEGTGLLLMAGPSFNPVAYTATPLVDLLPVDPGAPRSTRPGRPRAEAADLFQAQLSPLGRSHAALQLADDPQANAERWQSLPGVFWFSPVHKLRPGASAFLVHPSETTQASPPEPLPLLAAHRFGKGRVFYCGIDETWRWRQKQGDRVFYRLWGQFVHYLGTGRLAGGRERVTLRTDKAVYGRGETAVVTLHSDEPIEGSPLLVAESEDGEQVRLPLAPSPGGDRLYEASLPLRRAGLTRLWADGYAMEASVIVEVQAPQLELQEPAANVSLLREIAENTGGRHATADDFGALLAAIDVSPRTVVEQQELTLWDRPALALLFVALLAAEWILRRLWQLP